MAKKLKKEGNSYNMKNNASSMWNRGVYQKAGTGTAKMLRALGIENEQPGSFNKNPLKMMDIVHTIMHDEDGFYEHDGETTEEDELEKDVEEFNKEDDDEEST